MKKRIMVFTDLRAHGPAQTIARIFNALSDLFDIYVIGFDDPFPRHMYFNNAVHFIDYSKDTTCALFNYEEITELKYTNPDDIDLGEIKKISFFLRKIKPSLVFCFGVNHLPVLKYIKKKNPGVTLILYDALHPEGSYPPERRTIPRVKHLMEITYYENYPAADLVLMNQEKMGKYLKETFNVSNAQYFGFEIDQQKYREMVHTYRYILPVKDCYWIVSIGSLQARKNQILLLQAFKKIKNIKKARLLVIGKGEDENKLKEWVNKEDMADRVDFIGHCITALPYIEKATVLVHTSKNEGMPNVIGEAMTLGTAVISTCWNGVEEIIENNVNGIITGFDANEIAEKIDLLLENDELRTRLTQKARIDIGKFDISKQAQKFIDLFNKYIKKNEGTDTGPVLEDRSNEIAGESIALFGSGKLAEVFVDVFRSVNITNVYDSKKDKWERTFVGRNIKMPTVENLRCEKKIVVCSSYGWRDIVLTLVKKGVTPRNIYIYLK